MVSIQIFLLQILVLSLFLLVGYLLRLKVRLFQRLFVPAPVIAGLVGLLLGPEVLGAAGILPSDGALGRWYGAYSREWIPIFRLLPGVLITPVMAASILGMGIPSRREMAESVGRQLGYTIAFYGSQFALGGIVGMIFLDRVYPTFGLELFAGFAGGHGTAGVYGQTLRSMEADFWQVGQGVALTTATYGLVFGVVAGIGLINFCARKGATGQPVPPGALATEAATGFFRDPGNRAAIGRSVTAVDVLDPISYTVALIAVPSLIGVAVQRLIGFLEIPGLAGVGEYAWALVAAAVLWGLVDRLGYSYILDPGTKNRVAGTLVDFLVVAAIVSMPIQAVFEHILPISVLIAVGSVSAVAMFFVGRRLLPDCWVERSIMTFGQCTGVTATGLLLLRIVDPDFKTPALSAWGMSYAVAFPLALIYLGLGTALMIRMGALGFTALSLLITAAGLALVFLFPQPRSGRAPSGIG